MSKAKVVLNAERIQYSLELLRALAHPLRIKILGFIDQHRSVNVNKIYNSLHLEQSIVSQHLKVLRSVGLVTTEREGKFIHYRVDYPTLQRTVGHIRQFMNNDESQAD